MVRGRVPSRTAQPPRCARRRPSSTARASVTYNACLVTPCSPHAPGRHRCHGDSGVPPLSR
eukprot:scaffold25184_cov62-Phaeocystis_antarctica.AAC.2